MLSLLAQDRCKQKAKSPAARLAELAERLTPVTERLEPELRREQAAKARVARARSRTLERVEEDVLDDARTEAGLLERRARESREARAFALVAHVIDAWVVEPGELEQPAREIAAESGRAEGVDDGFELFATAGTGDDLA